MENNFCEFEELVLFDLWIPDSEFRICGFRILVSDSGFRFPGFRFAKQVETLPQPRGWMLPVSLIWRFISLNNRPPF